MVSGPCIALEVRQENVISSFKALCGAYDPEVGRAKGEKNSLRSLFGVDKIRNAVHCTDLPDEGVIECEFFFVILQEKKSN